jgi:hypothetical protein
MMHYAQELRAGKAFRFGDIIVHEDGCEIVLHKLFRVDRIKAPWSDLQIWSHDGSFIVGDKSNKKAYSSASYKDVDNTHVIEQMIRTFFKNFTTAGIGESLLG